MTLRQFLLTRNGYQFVSAVDRMHELLDKDAAFAEEGDKLSMVWRQMVAGLDTMADTYRQRAKGGSK